jgi:CDGSH-type Zn-finger protein
MEEKRIEIQPNGPYRVYGGIPLKEMAPVHTFNGEPVDWHVIRDLGTPGDYYELCRCGQSKNKPFCDSSHEKADFDGTETAMHAPFRGRAETWDRDKETLGDDISLCIQAGFCKTRTQSVWALFAHAEKPEARQQMREMVWNCPSGRLTLLDSESFPVEPPFEPEIAVTPGGPLWVRGGIPIIAADGRIWEPRNRVTLCRCGGSVNKPFCDASHLEMNFDER